MNKKRGITYEFFEGKSKANINLVFVHGTGCNRNFLRSLSNELTEYNRYLIDLPGHGNSDNTGYSAENYVNCLCDFVSDMYNVILIGHSLGGTIVIGTGAKMIKSVNGLVILNSGASFPKIDSVLLESLKKNIVDFERFNILLGHTDNLEVQQTAVHIENEDIALKDALISVNISYEEVLDKIKVPVCIIAGDNDIFTVLEFSENLNNKIKDSTLHVLTDAAHSLPITHKKEASNIISNFVNNIKI